MTALPLKYDAARAALAECRRIDEVKDFADKAEALRAYARQAGDVQMEQDFTEIRLRAIRRFGEIEIELRAAGRFHKGGRPAKTSDDSEPVTDRPIKLADLGVTKRFSANAQAVAGIAERAFEAMVARKRDEIANRGGRVGLDIAREQARERRRTEHAERVYEGMKVEDLHALAASGFKAGAILTDPPWHFLARSEKGEGRSAAQHYTTDRLGEITSLPVAQLAAPDCVLFTWMVDWCPKLALDVIEAWGFAHKTTAFTWVKQQKVGDGWHMGQGYWTRANPEDCWLATRGSPKRIDAGVRQLLLHPVMEHSRKPDEVHERIKALVAGPYLELYARRAYPGWTTWGNEIPRESIDPTTGEITEAA